MLEDLNEARVDLIQVERDLTAEKGKLHGITKGDPRRAHEVELIAESQEIRIHMAELKLRMNAAGEPALGLADVLDTLYAIETYFGSDDLDEAWDATTGLIDSIEKILEDCAK